MKGKDLKPPASQCQDIIKVVQSFMQPDSTLFIGKHTSPSLLHLHKKMAASVSCLFLAVVFYHSQSNHNLLIEVKGAVCRHIYGPKS